MDLQASFNLWNGSFHPNAIGQWWYAAALSQYIRQRIYAGYPLNPSGLPSNPEPTYSFDAFSLKADFGRSLFSNPCSSDQPCNGDFDCDGDVDGSNAHTFKLDFGRSSMINPCPRCVTAHWCEYP